MAIKVDALRVVQDPKYAASLSDEHWQALQHDPEWNLMVGEYHEMVEPVLARYGRQLGVPAPRSRRELLAQATASAAADENPSATGAAAFQVLGKRVPRLHGYGVVTNVGQYTENMRM